MSDAVSLRHGPFGRVGLYKLDRGFVTHAHREAHLFFYVAGNPGIMRVSGQNLSVDPFHAVAISPWEPHSFEPAKNGDSAIYLVLYINPGWVSELQGLRGKGFAFGENLISLSPSAARWTQRLSDLLAAKDESAEVDVCLFETTCRCHDLSWRRRRLEMGDERALDGRISRALGIMNECFAGDVEMDWLARESCLSRPHFFNAITELLETKKSVTEIGFDLGYSSQASFTRFFATNVGIAPTDYRRAAMSS